MEENQKTIVCVGDSTTSMEWCHPNWFDWIDFSLRQGDEVSGWKTKMINSGKDGGTIPFFLEHFDFLIGRFKPEIVILSLGFNHLEIGGDTEDKLRGLVLKIKEIGSKVVMWATYKTIREDVNSQLSGVRDIYKKVANDLDAQFVDMYEEFSRYDLSKVFDYKYLWENVEWQMKPGDVDFLHCNLIGNQIIAEKLAIEVLGIELEDFGDFGTMRRVKLDDYLKK